MNWRRGFRRIGFVLGMTAAVFWAASSVLLVLLIHDAAQVPLQYWEERYKDTESRLLEQELRRGGQIMPIRLSDIPDVNTSEKKPDVNALTTELGKQLEEELLQELDRRLQTGKRDTVHFVPDSNAASKPKVRFTPDKISQTDKPDQIPAFEEIRKGAITAETTNTPQLNLPEGFVLDKPQGAVVAETTNTSQRKPDIFDRLAQGRAVVPETTNTPQLRQLRSEEEYALQHLQDAKKGFWVNLSKGGLVGICTLAGLVSALIGFVSIWLVYRLLEWLVLGFCEDAG